MRASQFVGIDVGTSFIKAAIIDLDRRALVRTERAPFPAFVAGLPDGFREVSPSAVMTAVRALSHSFDGDFGGVVLCGQMHGFILVDRHGEAVSNYVSWLDSRAVGEDFVLTADELRAVGNEFRPGIAFPMLWWMRRRGSLPDGATPVSIADFVAAQLCQTAPVMEPTQAAAFGALRLGTLSWHTELIRKAELDSLAWPAVRPSGSVVGEWRGVPCYAAVGDQQCALAGALLGERELSINIGTGSQVAVLTDSISDQLQTRPYFDGRLLRTITHIPGGRALSALVGLLAEIGGVTEEEAWKKIEIAESTDLRAAISFYPGACGERGFLENLHEGNMRVGHVFRAVFESMAANYQTCAGRLGGAVDGIVFSGGVARRLPLVRELTSGALGLPARVSPHEEDTLFGLMVLALAYSGRAGSVQAATAMVESEISSI